MSRRTTAIAASAGALCAAALAALPTLAGADTSGRAVLAGTAVPANVRTHNVGAVSASTRIDFQLVLKLRDAAGAQAALKAISTPASASFRHYMTAKQWEAQFSPTEAQVTQATAWLRSEGFSVGKVSKDRITIGASGTATQVESAFGTGLANYQVGGKVERLATGDLSVPASLAGAVVGAMGVNESIATPADADIPGTGSASSAVGASPDQFPPAPGAFITAAPCSSYWGAESTAVHPPFGSGYPTTVPDEVCGYKPGQFRSAYGVTSAATGKGETVAIIDAYGSATIAQDANAYFSNNDPGNAFAKASFSQIDATPFDDQSECDPGSWLTEQAIDVEAVHSTAPNAHILYVGAQDCVNGLFTAEQNVIDNGLANVITNSWADTGGDLLDDAATKTAYDDLFMLAGSTGVTVQFSTGDDGDNFYIFGVSVANYPSDSPFATGVGGTSLMINSSGQRIGELGWDTGRSFLCQLNGVNVLPGCTAATVGTWLPATLDGATGGYTSYYYTQPWYQAPVVPADLSLRNEAIFGPVPLRVIPDISLDADPSTGFLIGLHETFPNGAVQYGQTRYGGTSLASPLLAGIVADADQAAGIPVGFINPDIYKLDLSDPSAINDVLPESSPQGDYRTDHAFTYGGTSGFFHSFRELYYSGDETYCDATGNCYSRQFPLTATPGYDSLTGLGSPGSNFISALGNF